MQGLGLHHVSVPVRDLHKAVEFYEQVLGLQRITRPGFAFTGAWFGVGAGQLHLIVNAEGTYRATPQIDTQDAHFALRTGDFEATVTRLSDLGYGVDLSADDPKRVVINPGSATGFAQLFLIDPDGHTVEINAAAG